MPQKSLFWFQNSSMVNADDYDDDDSNYIYNLSVLFTNIPKVYFSFHLFPLIFLSSVNTHSHSTQLSS